MEVPGMEGQETKNTAFVNAPETLVTLMSDAVMARWRHAGMPIEATIRRRLLANDRDLYFLQKKTKKTRELVHKARDGYLLKSNPNSTPSVQYTSCDVMEYPEGRKKHELVD